MEQNMSVAGQQLVRRVCADLFACSASRPYAAVSHYFVLWGRVTSLMSDGSRAFLEDLRGPSAYEKSFNLFAVSVEGATKAEIIEVTKAMPPEAHLHHMLISQRPEDGLTDSKIVERYVRWFLGEGFEIRWRFFFPGGESNQRRLSRGT